MQGRFKSSQLSLHISGLALLTSLTVLVYAYQVGANTTLLVSACMALFHSAMGLWQLATGERLSKHVHLGTMYFYVVGLVFAGDFSPVPVYVLMTSFVAFVLLYRSRKMVIAITVIHLLTAMIALRYVPTGEVPTQVMPIMTMMLTGVVFMVSTNFNLKFNKRYYAQMTSLQRDSEARQQTIEERKRALHASNLALDRARAELQDRAEQYEVRLAKLRETNLERASLAQAASSDIKQPLRNIGSFIQLIGKELDRRNLTGGVKDYLHFVTDGAARMSAMVEDLLAYCDYQASPHVESVDTHALVQSLEGHLANLLEREDATIEINGLLPTVQGQRTQVLQLFQNLISNGIKFRRPGVDPVCVVGCDIGDQAMCFYVRDNGIGMPADRLQDVFGLFTRLHERGAYEGTGIGLSLCRRIVITAGGEIWAESEEGVGTTFRFTWPLPVAQVAEAPAMA